MMLRRFAFAILLAAGAALTGRGQGFVARSGAMFLVEGRPAWFLGANAYYLSGRSAIGDTAALEQVLAEAAALGMTTMRTWAFFDSPDSNNPAVIQYLPGRYNETALRGLDEVVYRAKGLGLRVILPLVNSWDDFGGMNQYVRWRVAIAREPGGSPVREPLSISAKVAGSHGQSYRLSIATGYGHDTFYTDSLIQQWFRSYIAEIVMRVNTRTGLRYRDEPCIMAWELANEPRSSDPTGGIVTSWLARTATFIRSIDPNHLIGTGEEGFDTSPASYTSGAYSGQGWLFDGTAGVSFSSDVAIDAIDFGNIHLYPEAWGIPNSAGTSWMEDHMRIARESGKPLLMGEFGVTVEKATTYESWLTTGLLDGIGGAAVWELLGGRQSDPEGFGVQCPGSDQACSVLEALGAEFRNKTLTGSLPVPHVVSLLYNYPNPFNRQTVIAYTLPFDSHVELVVYNMLGERVGTIVNADQRTGVRKELLDARGLASGTYFYRLIVNGEGNRLVMTGKAVLVK